MPGLLELPLELVLAIMQLLGNEDLRQLSLVCQRLRPDCQATLLQTCTIPITLERSVEEYRVLFQTPYFIESIRFLSFRGRFRSDNFPDSSADEQTVFTEIAGRIPTLHRLQCIKMSRTEPSLQLLDAIFCFASNKLMKLVLSINAYPEEYIFPAQDLKIHHIEACVTKSYGGSPRPYATTARSFLPRLVSACAATLSRLHIYDDHTHTKMWDIPPVRLRSLTATATRDPSLVAFLQSQTSLEELTIRHDEHLTEGWASKLSQSDLPELRSVTASCGSLRYLVAGRAIREANPDICCGSYSHDLVRDFLRNTRLSASGKGIESVDLGSVLNAPMGVPVLAEFHDSLSTIQSLGIPCRVQVRQSHVILGLYLRPWKEFSQVFTYLRSLSRLTSLYLLEELHNWKDPPASLETEMIEHSSSLRKVCQSFERLTVSSYYNKGQLHVDYDLSIEKWTLRINKSGRSRWAPRFT